MSNNPTEESVIRMEAIYKEIDDKAKEAAMKATGYEPDYDESLGFYNPKKAIYDQIRKYFKMGATPYGEKLVAAEEQLDKMAKAFELIKVWCKESGLKHADIGNPIHMAVYHSLHQAKTALTDYQTFKQGKDGEKS